MYREVVSWAIVCVLLMQVALVMPAPVAEKGSQLTVHFNDLAAGDDEAVEGLSRHKRHASSSDSLTDAGDDTAQLMNLEPVGDSARVSRQRRSAAFFLSAAIKLCDQHPHLCATVEVRDEDVRLTVRISDE